MSATNSKGWEIQAYDNRMGWRQASKTFSAKHEDVAALDKIKPDTVARRVYEVLEAV